MYKNQKKIGVQLAEAVIHSKKIMDIKTERIFNNNECLIIKSKQNEF